MTDLGDAVVDLLIAALTTGLLILIGVYVGGCIAMREAVCSRVSTCGKHFKRQANTAEDHG